MATTNTNSRENWTDADFAKELQHHIEKSQKFRATSREKLGLVSEDVNVYSDGTRMSGVIWKTVAMDEAIKSNSGKTFPAIVLAQGFGGKRFDLDYSYAPRFCNAGLIVLSFSYRGWDDSDGILIAAEKQPVPDKDGVVNIKARIVRRIVDPEWQIRDVDSAINYLTSVKGVDINRIGIWGSSFGGGHALAIAARDPRIKCVVCQIGSIDTHANWVNRHPQYRGEYELHKLAASHARGEIMPWHVQRPIGLDGVPNLPKTVFEHTNNTVSSLDRIRCPVLLLAAEKEETFHNSKNSDLVYEKLKGRVPVEISYLPGGHYDAYFGEAYKKGVAEASRWFQIYLGVPPPPQPKTPVTTSNTDASSVKKPATDDKKGKL